MQKLYIGIRPCPLKSTLRDCTRAFEDLHDLIWGIQEEELQGYEIMQIVPLEAEKKEELEMAIELRDSFIF